MNKRITYNGIAFLHHEETYEIRKNQTGTIRYYTREDTGESGMSLRGLANGCGISDMALRKFLDETTILDEVRTKSGNFEDNILNKNENKVRTKPDIFLIQADNDVHVIRDTYCERIIYYYAFESRYKKTKVHRMR